MHQNRGINRTFVPIIVRVGLTLPVFPSVYYQHRIIRRTTPGQNRYAMTFQELNLIEPLKRAVAEKSYTTPTPIQQQAIPPALEGRDLLGCAQTGTGKTAAFTLPILQLLSAEPRTKGRRTIKALVLTPTRELAIQIDECCRDYARYTDIRHCVIFGGVNQRPQVDALQKGVDLLVATPGRLLDLIGQGYVTLDTIRFFVLDEADRMLDMGFIHDIRRILPLLPERRQTLFFSATMPESIAALAAKILRNPVLVTVTPPASVVETIAQTVHFAEKAEKSQLLIDLLSASDAQQVLVFSRTKHGADKLAKILNRAGIRSCAIHGNKSQNARVKAMNDFKSGECRVMIATDIAARGIDIDQLPLVINYELPEVAETYVHRIGRTGRAGHEGAAWSFCSEDEFEYLCDIQKLTGLTIPTEGPVPEYALRKAAPARKPAQKAAQRPAHTQEPKPARNAGAKSAQRPARDADAGQQPAQRPARNTEQKAARNAAKTPQSAQNPAQPEAGATSRPSRPRRRRGTRPAPGTPIEPAGKTASRPADATRGQAPKQGPGNAAKAAGNKSAATAAPKNAPNPAPAPSAKPSRRRKRRGSGNAAGSAATAIAAPAATAEAPQKKWWKRWL